MDNSEARIAVIGGSGLYEMDGLENVRYVSVDTPFGAPSDEIVIGNLEGQSIAFLPRHGRGHRINPSSIPVRANIYALKQIGVQKIISVSAVGSLKEELAPLDLVIPDQLIDRTRQRANTFFDDGLVVHIGFAEPFCRITSQAVYDAALGIDLNVHLNGTMVVMEDTVDRIGEEITGTVMNLHQTSSGQILFASPLLELSAKESILRTTVPEKLKKSFTSKLQ